MAVTIRTRTISGNRKSIYLDTGKAPNRMQGTGLYLLAGSDKVTKQINKETMAIAKQMAANLERKLTMPNVYTPEELSRLKMAENGVQSFYTFIQDQARKKKMSNYNVCMSMLKHLKICWGEVKLFAGISNFDIDEFREYLLDSKLSQNSAACYFASFKSMVSDAYRYGYVKSDLSIDAGTIAQEETEIGYLTQQELTTLYKAPCKYDGLKEMALFSAFTGLRWSDCSKLEYSQIGDGEIRFTQTKTGKDTILPISKAAMSLLPTPPTAKKEVFAHVDYDRMRVALKDWLQGAGIKKDITFHSFRHSYAMMLLENDVDLLTISEMLGHKSIKSTQVYAKASDQRKRNAADSLCFVNNSIAL